MTSHWQTVVSDYQAQRQASIPEEWRLPSDLLSSITVKTSTIVMDIPRSCGILSSTELDITEHYTAVQLLEKLRTGFFSAVQVTTAFCKRAAVAHQLVNCCTEMFFELALKRAKECDDYLSRENKTMGPLHGLPISVKDMFHVAGVRTTAGFVSHASDPVQSNAAGVTKTLYSLGAVFYVKTNMSQMGFSFDSHNNLFGRTLNPLNTSLTPGGSSGGESALIALRGSILGVGSDALGSLRTPAHATGVYTIKPSPFRVPTAAFSTRTKGAPGNPLHVGPLATSLEDLKLFMEVVVQTEPWKEEASMIYCPWNERNREPKNQKMRIGVVVEDESLPLYPPMQRAMKNAAERLTNAGHILIDLKPGITFPALLPTAQLTLQLAVSDPYSPSFAEVLKSGEPLVPSVAMSIPSSPEARERMKPSLEKVIAAEAQRQDLAEEVRRVWTDNMLDVILMPLHNTVAPRVDKWASASYLALWNLLPYPAVVMPFGNAEGEKDKGFTVMNPDIDADYHPTEIEGMPCSIQVVGRSFRDEEVLRLASEIEQCLRESVSES